MKDSLSLGRVAGVPVGLNWSVLVIAALLVYTLATEVFPSAAPGLGDGVYLAMAAVGSLLFLVSILLHELGHAMQARRDGMEIDGITLWLFGGVARFRGAFRTAGAEARIAIAGPLVSLAIGAALLAASYLPGLPPSVETVWAWLGLINLALLVFNLLPALPLDGGRVLRAALWWRTGDLRRATRWAAVTAAVIAYLMIGGGLALMVLDDLVSGLWLAFIGWFLLQAASAEERAAGRRSAAPLRVSDVLAPRAEAVSPEGTIAGFLGELARRPDGDRRRAYPVAAGGRAVGLITVAAAQGVPPAERGGARVAEHMTPLDRAAALRVDDDLAAAVVLLRLGAGRALVLDGERPVGVLHLDEVVDALERRRLRPAHRAG
jgi:Zn-dependent protease